MANNQFISLEELSKTTQALLSKINEQSNLKVNKVNVSAELSEGTKIGSIEGVEFYTPEVDLSNYPTYHDLASVAITGSYNNLRNKPTIPSKTSQLTNDSGYITSSDVNTSTFMVKGTDYVTAGQKSGTTLGDKATAEGYNTTASGYGSHAEGYNTTADGPYSHAEGDSTTASQAYSHAEGSATKANGAYSHAEGYNTNASGYQSHAEGSNTTASGYQSHAEGLYTIARRKSQHVFGEYNILDTSGSYGSVKGQYIEIVGNGTAENARSNARTLDWSGNEVLAGKLTIGTAPTADMDVTTKQYVDNKITTDIATAIGDINQFEVTIVTDLPTTDINTHTIYFKSNSSSGNNVYDEYMYINNNWELIGSTQIDLTPYARSADLATVATSGDYDDLIDAPAAEMDANVEDMLDNFYLDYTSNISNPNYAAGVSF